MQSKDRIEKMRAFIIQFAFYCILLLLIFVTLKYLFPLLSPFVTAFVIAFLLKPVIHYIHKHTGLKRRTAAILSLCAFYILFLTLLIVVGTRLVLLLQGVFHSLPQTYASLIEPALNKIQFIIVDVVENLNPDALSIVNEVSMHLNTALSGLVSSLSSKVVGELGSMAAGIPTSLVNLIITIVASFFFVVDYYKVTGFIAKLLPPRGKELLFEVKSSVVTVLFQFGRAYALLMGLTFVELFVGLLLLRVPYAFLLALLIAVVDILPVLGTGTIVIPWGIITLILGNFPLGIGLLILYAIITVVRQSLEPRVVGHQIGLHPLITLISMFVGVSLFGFLGLFGLPIAVTVFVQIKRAEKENQEHLSEKE